MNHTFRFAIALLFVSTVNAQELEQRLKAEPQAKLAADARQYGDPARGAAIFHARVMACSVCHSVGERAESIGPDLTKLDAKSTDVLLVEAVLEPSKTIAPAYSTLILETVDGRVVTGLLASETAEQIVVRDATQPDRLITLMKREIESREVVKQSIMPSAQVNQLRDRQQFLDLVRYLMELREGGAKRARELQPPADPYAQKVPDEPLPWQPVVQRGLVILQGGARYPRGVALGFSGGTVLFDGTQLATVASWHGGFVKSATQNYFGLDFHQSGSPAESLAVEPHPLKFKLPGRADWQIGESATTSDPNEGTRFEGYQIGRSAIRLRYLIRVDDVRVGVTEDVRAETRPAWQGVVRSFQFTGLPAGAQVAVTLPMNGERQYLDSSGRKVEATADVKSVPLLVLHANGQRRVVRAAGDGQVVWLPSTDGKPQLSIATTVSEGKPAVLRIDAWKHLMPNAEPGAAEFASLISRAPELDDDFNLPRKPSSSPPEPAAMRAPEPVANRPAVKPAENIDEFPSTRGRFLRFTVTGTNDNTEPGLDELEVYGADPNVNLALRGKATASSVIEGYPIHQVPHLNDGKLGNNNSWISKEKGGGWAQIEMPEPVDMRKIVWARDRTGVCKDRLAVEYRIEISDDAQTWIQVGDERGRVYIDRALGAIRRDASPGYVMESIPLPFPSCRPSDIAFSEDGVLYALSLSEGQVWRTRIPSVGAPDRVQWQRYASGLNHPLGLIVVDGRLFIAQKPEITELIDRNGDGTVDEYKTFASGWGLSAGWHEYCFGLALDTQRHLWFTLNTGNFWTHPGLVSLGRWRGSVMRVGIDSGKIEEVARGCRTPNGIARGPEGNMFFTDNQGDWIQTCKLAHIVPGRFYGHPETKDDALPKDTWPTGRSTVWLPHPLSRSSSGPVHDATGGKFGPFADQLFVGDVGYGANPGILRVALEKVKGEYQGACFRFIDGQPLGCERMKFGADNQLYMASLTTGLTRVAFNGNTPLAMQSVRIRPGGRGFNVHFTKPLADSKIDPAQLRIKRFHYLYTGNYGSPQADERSIPVEQTELSTDRTTLTLSFPVETYPLGMVYEISLGTLKTPDGEPLLHHEAWYTVHDIPD